MEFVRMEKAMKEKSHVEDIDRSVYDIKDEEKDAYRLEEGLTSDIVEKLSKEKHDPEWMHDLRMKSLEIYNNMKVPDWGPSIDGLDVDHIATYVRPNTNMKGSWEEVPDDIKNTFDRLGIPQAERYLYRYGKCPDRKICRYGKGTFYEVSNT